MSMQLETRAPAITSISPQKVQRGWEGIVKIQGSGFDAGSFAMFNAAAPLVLDQSSKHIAVEIHPDLTAIPGRQTVQVRTTEGGTTNEVEFVVTP